MTTQKNGTLAAGLFGLRKFWENILPITSLFVMVFTFYFDKGFEPQHNQDKIFYALTFCCAIFSVYLIMQYAFIRTLYRTEGDLRRQIAEKSQIDSDLSAQMIAIARLRGRFDDALFEAAYKAENANIKDVRTAFTNYLNGVCDGTAAVLAVLKKASPGDFQVNVKILYGGDSGVRLHRTGGRSTINTNPTRLEHDMTKGPYLFDKNKCMVDALQRPGRKFSVIRDVASYVRAMKDAHSTLYEYPNENCEYFYRNIIMVPVTGPYYDKSLDRNINENLYPYDLGDGTAAYGFICVDSFNYEFDINSDLDILYEIAAELHSALKSSIFFTIAPPWSAVSVEST